VRRLAISPAYIGKRRLHGELIDARWEAIIDEDTFWAAQHVLSNPQRKKMIRPGKAKYLLSYVMSCGVCGAPMSLNTPRCRMVTLNYWCSEHEGHSCQIRMEDADAFVILAVKVLTSPDIYKHLVAGNDKQIVQARAEAARLRAELDEWASADISAHAYAIRESKLLPLIEAAEKRAEELTVPMQLRDLTSPGTDIAARWEQMHIAARRDVVRLLFPKLHVLDGTGPVRERIML
jgi:site-specific DNA recombinase